MASDSRSENDFRFASLLPVVFGMVLVSLPLYQYLSALVLWYVLILTVWSVLVVRGIVQAPAAWLRFMLAMLVVWALYYSYGSVFGLIPGTSMVILLSYLKLFEIKSKRDITVLIFLGYFLASSVFFHSQSLWVAFYVFMLAIYFTNLLVLIADRKGSVGWRERTGYAARMVLQSLPLMLVMFVLFPRIPGPLWSLPKDAQSASTGLSEEMTPGNVSQLVASYDVAFRVKFADRIPDKSDLYWRALVLSRYDGKTWRRDDAPRWTEPEVINSNNSLDDIHYQLTLEPHQQNWLYALEQITAYDGDYTITRELQLLSKRRINNVVSYNAQASFSARNRGLFLPERRKNLELPTGYNPETIKLGKRLARTAAANDREIIAAALRYFSEQAFFYTLTPPLLGDDGMDDFLFSSRRGFCEHYASAFVYLMRAAGVPARVVLGYQGGEINPVDGYMIVRQSDAHAWAEVWVDNQYWLRIDPTAVVSPQRIESGIQSAGLEPRLLPRMLQVNNALLNHALFIWDSVQNGWNQWVVGFDEQRQLELFKMLGVDKVEKSTLLISLVAAMSVVGALVAWWVIRLRSCHRKDRVRIHYLRFRQRLAGRGIAISEQDTPQELLAKVRLSLPSVVKQASMIIEQYQALVYGLSRNTETEKIFIKAVRRFRVS